MVRLVRTTAIRIDDLIAQDGSDAASGADELRPSADPVVLGVQRVLADLGYAPGRIDGMVGPETREAIARFRADRSLAGDGTITRDLLAELAAVTGKPVVP